MVLVYLIPGRIGKWKCWFLKRGENRSTCEKKPSRNEGENQQQQTEPTGVDSAWFGDVMLLGSLSNDDGDSNENGKKGLD